MTALLLLALQPVMAQATLSVTYGSAAPAISLPSQGQVTHTPEAQGQRQTQTAQADRVSGTAFLLSRQTGRKQPLVAGQTIRVGDEILTAQGSASVSLAEGSTLRLSSDSRLLFSRMDTRSGAADMRLRLRNGKVSAQVAPITSPDGHFEIQTTSAITTVRGTEFSLRSDARGTDVQVTEGMVEFGTPGSTRQIPAGYGARVTSENQGDLQVRQLPPAPTLDPLPDTLQELPATVSWQYQWPSRYRLDIFDEATGQWIETREVSDRQHPLSDLDNGQYEIQLAALQQNGMPGMPATTSFQVELEARPPTLLAPADDDMVNEVRPAFEWQLNGSNEIARVEIAETDAFKNLVATSQWASTTTARPSSELSPGEYLWRVVTKAGGTSKATSSPRTLVINGTLPAADIISVNYFDKQVRVYWEKVDTATGYRIQLAEEPAFENIIKEADVDDTTAALRLIPGRRYFIRVKAVSDGPLASRWGAGQELYLD